MGMSEPNLGVGTRLADVMEAACDGNLDDLQVRDEVKRIVLKAATPKPAVEGK